MRRKHVIATLVATVAVATGAHFLLSTDVPFSGKANPDITQANIQDTICNPNFRTGTIRPPTNYTNQLKLDQIMQLNYSDTEPSHYEEDHIFALTDGGDPKDPQNLWPQPYEPRPGAHEKDQVELYVHKQICSGAETLAQGQNDLLHWKSIYAKMKNNLGGVVDNSDPDDQ